jgi:hypothetical protein
MLGTYVIWVWRIGRSLSAHNETDVALSFGVNLELTERPWFREHIWLSASAHASDLLRSNVAEIAPQLCCAQLRVLESPSVPPQ